MSKKMSSLKSKSDFVLSQNLLNTILANHTVLLFQTLHYHWNIVGAEFHDYHLLFDKQYSQLFGYIDLVAERVRAVGGVALGSMSQCIQQSVLKEDAGKVPAAKAMIVNLLKQYEHLIEHLRESIILLEQKSTDFGTRKMLEDLIEQHEKTAWILRSLSGK